MRRLAGSAPGSAVRLASAETVRLRRGGRRSATASASDAMAALRRGLLPVDAAAASPESRRFFRRGVRPAARSSVHWPHDKRAIRKRIMKRTAATWPSIRKAEPAMTRNISASAHDHPRARPCRTGARAGRSQADHGNPAGPHFNCRTQGKHQQDECRHSRTNQRGVGVSGIPAACKAAVLAGEFQVGDTIHTSQYADHRYPEPHPVASPVIVRPVAADLINQYGQHRALQPTATTKTRPTHCWAPPGPTAGSNSTETGDHHVARYPYSASSAAMAVTRRSSNTNTPGRWASGPSREAGTATATRCCTCAARRPRWAEVAPATAATLPRTAHHGARFFHDHASTTLISRSASSKLHVHRYCSVEKRSFPSPSIWDRSIRRPS